MPSRPGENLDDAINLVVVTAVWEGQQLASQIS